MNDELNSAASRRTASRQASHGTLTKSTLTRARKHLRTVDPTMASLITKVGKTEIRSEADMTVYHSLVRAIVYQMLSTQSAAAIYGRLVDACGGDVNPDTVEAVGEQSLRDIGFSRAKVASVVDLTEKVRNGEIPSDAELQLLPDQSLIDCLTAVKGIGAWTVEMLMFFNLRRVDVFPATDLGVRKGHMLAYGLDEMLPARALLQEAEVWKPYRSLAAWYLWRATDSVDWSSPV